ncbi:solute carrier family 2 [Striga asiatica]|uniref:Solute carrier family 2 n=1 Tax=Striga asiatica TaxID=4170 RepID=A0A5A7PVA7_STRAF|nr:solute carrier family 2 [Striga asiatica]
MVHTTVLPVSTVFLTVLITIAAALASSPDVGSSMNIIEGLATNSTAIVSLFLCSVESPLTPGKPTRAPPNGVSSTICASISRDNLSQAEYTSDSYTVTFGEWMSFCSQ